MNLVPPLQIKISAWRPDDLRSGVLGRKWMLLIGILWLAELIVPLIKGDRRRGIGGVFSNILFLVATMPSSPIPSYCTYFALLGIFCDWHLRSSRLVFLCMRNDTHLVDGLKPYVHSMG
ncbi:uncharacterized protein GGS22DRAFT_143903 [Annulohypoxylon maeteangense]|uniref:uncharacterized protein n=1 Tax=Annulohypoxylon maeteangense TaxID=1927788 RepID=UPI0020084AE4|nr:uncharacterized protein GGS22DRAFT_143903 [Annulohypoxylon maeteangense]KAI0884532.1 hypothetical protein GGS22DRAFT_143903 [Annulohypoxylon maeteangense]